MSFLSIPSQDSLFTTVKVAKSADGSERFRTVDADEDDEDDEDDTDVRLIPRCSPVPRRRGSSIADETAEYMRIQQALYGGKRVSFADTTGGDLVDVKEFTAFDSDDEDSTKWEEEEAKYRETQQVPNYHVRPEFTVPTGSALLKAVRTNKVEVENISPVENEPLAFCGVVRVLNISFNKAVYIRCTMDNWSSYYDYPAEYVQGSNDGDTDQFGFKLCFAPPYTTHGSRIEFVIRYETSEGDYWANNSHMNYVVTLLLSYENKSSEGHIDVKNVRSILKPPKHYRTEMDLELEDSQTAIEGEQDGSIQSGPVQSAAICPIVSQPDLDLEIGVHPSPTVPPNGELPSLDEAQSTHCETAISSCTSSSVSLQTCLPCVLQASEEPPTNEYEQHAISPPASFPSMSPFPLCHQCPCRDQTSPKSKKRELWPGTDVLVCWSLSAQSPLPALPAQDSSRGRCGAGGEFPTAALHCGLWLSQTQEHEMKLECLFRSTTLTMWTSLSCGKTHCLGLQDFPHRCSDYSLALSSECDVHRSLRPSIIFPSALVLMSVALQESSTLFVIGLL